MKPFVLIFALAATPALAIDVPSGASVDLQEVLVDDLGIDLKLRFRFVSPQISRDTMKIDPQALEADMEYLCREVAVPYVLENGLQGDVIVMSLADRPTKFGAPDPDATQVFEVYRLVDGACIWDGI